MTEFHLSEIENLLKAAQSIIHAIGKEMPTFDFAEYANHENNIDDLIEFIQEILKKGFDPKIYKDFNGDLVVGGTKYQSVLSDEQIALIKGFGVF